MPKISVLVPVYNVEVYLEQCIQSLLAQTFQDMEIVCIDDGSTDNSGRILDRYAATDERIKVIHKENTGYGNSMNVALDHAIGDYIAILESDDFAEPDMLQKLYEVAVKQSLDVVKADYYNYRNGVNVPGNRLRDFPKGRVLCPGKYPEILNLADTIWSCLYRRNFLLAHDIRFHETPGASYQDISFAIQVWLHAGRVYFMEDAVLHYRRDNPGASMNNPSKLFCVFDEYEWIEEKYWDYLKSNWVLDCNFVASKYRDYFNHYHRVGIQYQYALLMRLSESFQRDKREGRVQADAFLPPVWQKLCDMEMDLNLFFRNTAKNHRDERLSKCRIQNQEVYVSAFFAKLQNYPQMMVYGAGKIGQDFARAVTERGGHVSGFIVTKLFEQERECMGISIYEVQEIIDMVENCAIVIAVAERTQYELYQKLERYGFQHIFRVDEIIRQSVLS